MQNMKTPLCVFILVIEGLTLLFLYKVARQSKSKIFVSKLHMLSLINIILILAIFAVFGLHLEEWHTEDYVKSHFLTINNKFIGNGLTYFIICLIVVSIILELAKGVVGAWEELKNYLKAKKLKKNILIKGRSTQFNRVNTEEGKTSSEENISDSDILN
jgi:membrane-associated HD superfamily phosphohydrolase